MQALQWTDVAWITRTLTVSKSLEQTAEGLRVERPKSGKTQTFTVPQSVIVALRFIFDQQADHKLKFGADYRETGLVFAQPSESFSCAQMRSRCSS